MEKSKENVDHPVKPGSSNARVELTLSQMLRIKGWKLQTNVLQDKLAVRVESRLGAALELVGRLNGQMMRFVEDAFKGVVPAKISRSSVSEAGITLTWAVKQSNAQTYAEALEWLEKACEGAGADANGVSSWKYTAKATRMTWSEYCELDSDEELEEDLEVVSPTEKQIVKLQKAGFEQDEDRWVRRVTRKDDRTTYAGVLKKMAQEYKRDQEVPPKTSAAFERSVLDIKELTPMKALTTDLNALGDKLRSFTHAGGKPRSNRKLQQVSGWFPKGKLPIDEFYGRFEDAVRQHGAGVFEGFSSHRDLAMGLFASRKSQIEVNDGLAEFVGVRA